MARVLDLVSNGYQITKDLTRSLQSGHLNFLIGSGASQGAIPLAGNFEAEVDVLRKAGNHAEANRRVCEMLRTVQEPTNKLMAGSTEASIVDTLRSYQDFLRILERILVDRRTSLLPRRATVFTTNYDMFIERASLSCEMASMANGFGGTSCLEDAVEFSSKHFFQTTFDSGRSYDYRVELPAINVVKLHGCLCWERHDGRIIQRTVSHTIPGTFPDDPAVVAALERYAIVLPQATKFETTVLDSTYYELLRLYSNSLDEENALLVAFGFSFRDEHILRITKRALTNPTLRLLIFAYDTTARDSYSALFAAHSNVIVLSPPNGEHYGFDQFVAQLTTSAPNRSDWA